MKSAVVRKKHILNFSLDVENRLERIVFLMALFKLLKVWSWVKRYGALHLSAGYQGGMACTSLLLTLC